MRVLKGAAVLGLALACGPLCIGSPAHAASDGPAGWLELNAGADGAAYRLTPGGSVHWPVDVLVRGGRATSLEVALEEGPASTELLRSFLAVELRACSEPWVQDVCGAGERVLLDRTALDSSGGVRADLMEPGTAVSDGGYVLLTASLAGDAPREIQGTSTQIVLGFHGAGDDPGSGVSDDAGTEPPAHSSGPASDRLASTGARLGAFTLLGLLAVAAGFGLARLRAAGT
ncbi:hypothetical protein [Arthrobacter sp. C152]